MSTTETKHIPRAYGFSDLARAVGIFPENLRYYLKRKDWFPKPFVEIDGRKLWDEEAVITIKSKLWYVLNEKQRQ